MYKVNNLAHVLDKMNCERLGVYSRILSMIDELARREICPLNKRCNLADIDSLDCFVSSCD